MFAQTFNYHDTHVQLRALGLVVLLATIVCLGILEFAPRRKRRVTAILASLSGLGSALVLVLAYIISKQIQ